MNANRPHSPPQGAGSFNRHRTPGALLALLLVVLLAPRLWAHVFPIRSEPKVGSEVKEAPSQVKIWFDGELEPAFSSMKLIGPDGAEVTPTEATVDEKEPTLLTLSLPKIGPGKYQVKWEVVAKDGHRTEGDFTFKLNIRSAPVVKS
jgi:methionine-rich copper-binding protein CopC